MADITEYFLATGENDSSRLEIINRLYNPAALDFMKKSGLDSGMTILEIGCGTGHMAIELAKIVGSSGKVIASDISIDQLKIAKNVAKKHNCNNIEFLQLDLNQPLIKLINSVDFIYGRWVIEFTKNTQFTFNELCKCLRSDGVLVYEGVDVSDNEYFSYPYNPTVEKWFKLILRNWQSNEMDISFVKHLYYELKIANTPQLNIAANQIILTTAEEKSILRLGFASAKDIYLKKGFLEETEYKKMAHALQEVECSNTIIGYVRNILVSAKCSKNK